MKITADRTELIRLIETASKVVEDNKIRPIISCVLIEAQETVRAIGTDLDITITVQSDKCVIEAIGTVAIQTTLLLQYLKSIDTKVVTIEKKEYLVIWNEGEIAAEFEYMNADEFPRMKNTAEGKQVTINKAEFVRSIKKVIFSAGGQDTPALNCIKIDQRGNTIYFVASDSFKMAVAEVKTDNIADYDFNLPLKTATALTDIISNMQAEQLTMTVDENKIYFDLEGIKLTSRLNLLAFPNYQAILSDSVFGVTAKVQVNLNDIEKKLKTIKVFSMTSENKNSAIFNFDGQQLSIKAIGKARGVEKLPIAKEGNNIKIALNVEFILQYLAKAESGIIDIKLKNERQAVIFESDNYRLLTMPLALREM